MSSSFHLKDWKDASETFQDMFSKLSIARDRSTSISNSEQPMKPKVCTDSLRKLEKEVNEVKTTFSASCEIVEKLREENYLLEKRLNENLAHENEKARYKKDLEHELTILTKSKKSSKDELLKENTKMRYRALKNIVQVQFNHLEKENNTLNGFVFNKTHNKIKPFSVNCYTKSPEEIKDIILVKMEEISGNNCEYSLE